MKHLNSAAASAALSAAYSALSADSAASAALSAAYSALSADSADSAGNTGWPPLWPGKEMPEGLAEAWTRLKARWEKDPDIWGFWLDWYEGLLNGTPMDWGLIYRIALEVSNEDWKAGPERVAERIREIEDGYWSSALPQHESLEKDRSTGRYKVIPAPFDPGIAVENWLKQIEFSVNICVESNTNDFNRMCVAFKFLDHTLQNCRDDPNAIEQNLGIAHGFLVRDLENDNFTGDDSVEALERVVEQIQTQMRADHPDVRKAWEKRIAQKLREVDRNQKLQAAEAIRAETERTQGRLSTEMELDAEAVETEGSEDAQATALRRAAGRSAKMNVLDRASKAVKDVDASAGYKATRMGSTGWNLVEMVRALFGG